jgi:hypothetical protein
LPEAQVAAPEEGPSPKALQPPSAAIPILNKAIAQMETEDGWEAGINYVTNQKTDPTAVAVDSGVAALTDGALHLGPGVRGVLPKTFGSSVDVVGKAHAARNGAESLFSTSMSMVGSGVYQYSRSGPNSGSASTGSGTSGSGTLNAKALGAGNGIGNFIGIYNLGSRAGTYNFGTGQWVK